MQRNGHIDVVTDHRRLYLLLRRSRNSYGAGLKKMRG